MHQGASYMVDLVLGWLESRGGVAAMQEQNKLKAATLYNYLDASSFYRPYASPECRSVMNVTFNLPQPNLESLFVTEAESAGLYGLKGHRALAGIRASLYNAMPMAGVEALVSFMKAFEQKHR